MTLLGLPAMFAWSSFWMTTSVATVLWGPISFVLIGFTLVGSFVLYRYVQGRADMPGRASTSESASCETERGS